MGRMVALSYRPQTGVDLALGMNGASRDDITLGRPRALSAALQPSLDSEWANKLINFLCLEFHQNYVLN